jgi:hypothetical protein
MTITNDPYQLAATGASFNTLYSYQCPRCLVELNIWGTEKKTLAENLTRGNRGNVDYSIYVPEIECPTCGYLVKSIYPELLASTPLTWDDWNSDAYIAIGSPGSAPANDQSILSIVKVPAYRAFSLPVGGDNAPLEFAVTDKLLWFNCPRCAANFRCTKSYVYTAGNGIEANYIDATDPINTLGVSYFFFPCLTCLFKIVLSDQQMKDLGISIVVPMPDPWYTLTGTVTDFADAGVTGAKLHVVPVTDITGATALPGTSGTDPNPLSLSVNPITGQAHYTIKKQGNNDTVSPTSGSFYKLQLVCDPLPAKQYVFNPTEGHVVRLPILDYSTNPVGDPVPSLTSDKDHWENGPVTVTTPQDATVALSLWSMLPDAGPNKYGFSFRASNPQWLIKGIVFDGAAVPAGYTIATTIKVYAWHIASNDWKALAGETLDGGGVNESDAYDPQNPPALLPFQPHAAWVDPVTSTVGGGGPSTANGYFAFYTTSSTDYSDDYKIVLKSIAVGFTSDFASPEARFLPNVTSNLDGVNFNLYNLPALSYDAFSQTYASKPIIGKIFLDGNNITGAPSPVGAGYSLTSPNFEGNNVSPYQGAAYPMIVNKYIGASTTPAAVVAMAPSRLPAVDLLVTDPWYAFPDYLVDATNTYRFEYVFVNPTSYDPVTGTYVSYIPPAPTATYAYARIPGPNADGGAFPGSPVDGLDGSWWPWWTTGAAAVPAPPRNRDRMIVYDDPNSPMVFTIRASWHGIETGLFPNNYFAVYQFRAANIKTDLNSDISALLTSPVDNILTGSSQGSVHVQIPVGTITGRVLTSTGLAVSGAKIECKGGPTPASYYTVIAYTNSTGYYTLQNLCKGTYTITASKPNYSSSSLTVTLEMSLATAYYRGGRGTFFNGAATGYQFCSVSSTDGSLGPPFPGTVSNISEVPAGELDPAVTNSDPGTPEYLVIPNPSGTPGTPLASLPFSGHDFTLTANVMEIIVNVYYVDGTNTHIPVSDIYCYLEETGYSNPPFDCTDSNGRAYLTDVPKGGTDGKVTKIIASGGPGVASKSITFTRYNENQLIKDVVVTYDYATNPNTDCITP